MGKLGLLQEGFRIVYKIFYHRRTRKLDLPAIISRIVCKMSCYFLLTYYGNCSIGNPCMQIVKLILHDHMLKPAIHIFIALELALHTR